MLIWKDSVCDREGFKKDRPRHLELPAPRGINWSGAQTCPFSCAAACILAAVIQQEAAVGSAAAIARRPRR
eukprot:6203627-Pleurochrysis_carterae.AAC.3